MSNKRNIIKKYDNESKNLILSNEFVLEYKNDINEKEEVLKDFKYNASFFKKLMHPLILIRTNKDLKKLKKIKEGLSEIVDKPLIEFVGEETGNIEEDLSIAMNYNKPYCVRNYMATNPVDDIGIVKKKKKNF